jgi:hypothetical protein
MRKHWVRIPRGWGPTVGKLYDYATRIQQHIESKGLDVYKTRGALAMKTGFLVTLVGPDDPDDPEMVQALRDAAWEVLGLKLE